MLMDSFDQMKEKIGYEMSSFAGCIGVAQADITPPVGIYFRNWGASSHDVAAGIHRPLMLTCITLQASETGVPCILVSADLAVWNDAAYGNLVRNMIIDEFSIPAENLMFSLTHTHASPVLSPDAAEKPGGEFIEAYLEHIQQAAIAVVRESLESAVSAILTWNYGKSHLAANRDFYDAENGRYLTGYNPDTVADDTLLVGRITDQTDRVIGTIVNYACHPTTLAWENQLISPDYVGAMRSLVSTATHAPCLFLQGASGDLAPVQQYTGDVKVADQNGRQLGYSVLAVLESMLPAGKQLKFAGAVKSGADLGIWVLDEEQVSHGLTAERLDITYQLKPIPPLEVIRQQYAIETDRVIKERLWRQQHIRQHLGDGEAVQMSVWIWHVGGAVLIGQPNEAYSVLQQKLRAALSATAVAVMNLVNGSAGYLPPRELYAEDIYTVWQTPFEAGSLEKLYDTIIQHINA